MTEVEKDIKRTTKPDRCSVAPMGHYKNFRAC